MQNKDRSAELKLAERAALWNCKQESRHFPSLLELARIATLTKKKTWTEPQRKMMRQAGMVNGFRTAMTLLTAR